MSKNSDRNRTTSSLSSSTKKSGFDPHAVLERRLREKRDESFASGEARVRVEDLGARVLGEVSATALVANARAVSDLVPGRALLPMVKADGYGHGASWVATQLAGALDHLYGFGVATLEEGMKLASEVPLLARRRIPVIVFSASSPWSREKGSFCVQHGLVPVLFTEEDFRKYIKEGWASRLPYELEFNTGMNRLGLPMESLQRVRNEISRLRPEERPRGIFSHLAVAEDPAHPLSRRQLERFLQLRRELAGASPASQFHLGNSAAIWNAREFALGESTDVVRPGLSLYGVAPWAGAPLRGLEPVLRLSAEVIQIHTLKAGESTGYGARFRVPGGDSKPVRVAILSCGYGDGIPRHLSGSESSPKGGFAWLGGRAVRFLGVVSMDLSAVECGEDVRVGDRAEILGPQVDIWAQARAAQTIPYELLTSLAARVSRKEKP
jgi:alanine racemase